MRLHCAFAALLVATASASPAEVKVDVRDDGIKLIKGEPPEARGRRLAARLVPIPNPQMEELLDRWAVERDLDPRLVQAVVQVESGYNPKALSNKGAIGLMQLMPGTAREMGVEDPWSPDGNVAGGTAYLRKMLDFFNGDLEFALAAYNAGPMAVLNHAGVPPYAETRAYVRKIVCLYEGACGDGGSDGAESSEPSGPPVRIGRDAEGRIVLSGGPGG
jgi:soluble lytic murein transglycosylase-like protein